MTRIILLLFLTFLESLASTSPPSTVVDGALPGEVAGPPGNIEMVSAPSPTAGFDLASPPSPLDRMDITFPPSPQGGNDIPSPPPPTEAQCDVISSVYCLRSLAQTMGSQRNMFQGEPTEAVNNICTNMENAFLCVGDKMNGCTGKYKLLFDTLLSTGRFLCNGQGRQGFVDNFQCLFSEKFVNSSNGCSTNVVTGMVEHVMKTAQVSASDPEEMCRLGNNMASCVMTTAMDACGVKGVEFIQQYISAAMSPMRQILACDPPAMANSIMTSTPIVSRSVNIAPVTETMPIADTTVMPPATAPPSTTQQPSTAAPPSTTAPPVTTAQPASTAQPSINNNNASSRGQATGSRNGRRPTSVLARRNCNHCFANRRNVPRSQIDNFDIYCSMNFVQSRNRYCPSPICQRVCTVHPIRRLRPIYACYAVGPMRELDGSDDWCRRRCPRGSCPTKFSSICRCVTLMRS